MSIRGSSRLRLSLHAIGAVALVYVLVLAGLQLLARRIEATGLVYPYRQEDWLRYLLPSLWQGSDRPLLLLTGPSNAREGLLFEEFGDAFPDHRVIQGAISVGTLTDVMAALAYVEHEYGPAALPQIMVLGVSPRFLADLPADGRPFRMGLERYSPRYRVADSADDGFALERKHGLDGALDRARFLVLKQHERYATAGHWLVARMLSPDLDARFLESGALSSGAARLLLPVRARHIGLHAYAVERTTPYNYRGAGPEVTEMILGFLDHPDSFWSAVWEWDAAAAAPAIRERVGRLLEYATSHGIELYVVNLPEGSANRTRYRPGTDLHYRSLLHSVFDTVPVLDLRCLLGDDEFVDAEHTRLRGSLQVTGRVIEFVRDVRGARLADEFTPASRSTIAARHAAGNCLDPADARWAN